MTDARCRAFLERLDDLLEGRMNASDRREAEEHLLSCRDCRELSDLSRGEGAPAAAPADLLGAILARTSGPACGSARGRLCDHADRLLAPVDDDLVLMHLEGCGECRGLASALARLAIDLPPLAEIEPEAGFLAGVLERTSRRETLADRLAAGFLEACRRLGRRPRIAWEGAYVGAIALLILFGTPNAPFAGVPGRALDLVRTAQEAVPAVTATEKVPAIRMAVAERWEETRTGVAGRTRGVAAEIRRIGSKTWDPLKRELGTMWKRIASQKTTTDGTNATEKTQEGQGE